jgi:hypothetical protein
MFHDLEKILFNNESIETVCSNLLLFVSDPCPLTEEIKLVDKPQKIYNLFKSHYFLSRVAILLNDSSKNEEAFDSVLFNISQGNVYLLIHQKVGNTSLDGN